MATRKAFLLEDLNRGYYSGEDYVKNSPYFSRDTEPAKDFDTQEEAENKLTEMSEECRDVTGMYIIVPVIIVY